MRRYTMVICAATVLGALLSSCNREPDFDERYDKVSRSIVDRAKAIDAEIASTSAATDDGIASP